MGRNCVVCNHPDAEKINEDLLHKQKTFEELSERWGISRFALRRHRDNHLKPVIDEAQAFTKVKAQEAYLTSVDALNQMIQKLPEMLSKENPSYTQLLDALKLRSELLGEKMGPSQVVITWGMGAGKDGDIKIADGVKDPEGITDEDVTAMMARKKEQDDG